MCSPADILILGNYRNALTVARCLGSDHRVVLGGENASGLVGRSRFVVESLPLPEASSDDFPNALESLVESLPAPPVLFPIGDVELAALLRVPSVVDGSIKAVIPDPEVVAICLDKATQLNLADRLSIPQSKYRIVKRLSELDSAVRAVGFPCIIKSDHQMSLAFGKKAIRIRTPDDLAGLISGEQEPKHGLIVQAVAEGLRHNVYFAAESGRLLGAMEARVLRTDIFDGSGYTVESISVPLNESLRRHTENLIEALGYHGIGNTQFLIDRQRGEMSFLEISPRMGAAFAVTVPAGFDFAQAGLSLAVGQAVKPAALPVHYKAGQRLAWSSGDSGGLVKAIRSRDVTARQAAVWFWEIFRAAAMADIHATWSWEDPLPTLANASAAAGRLRRIFAASK